jgi:hypothetical protein
MFQQSRIRKKNMNEVGVPRQRGENSLKEEVAWEVEVFQFIWITGSNLVMLMKDLNPQILKVLNDNRELKTLLLIISRTNWHLL